MDAFLSESSMPRLLRGDGVLRRGEGSLAVYKVHAGGCPSSRPSGTFLRIPVCAGGEAGVERRLACMGVGHVEAAGAAAGGGCCLQSPHEGRGWPCPRSPDPGDGPRRSGQTPVWACALSVLFKQRAGLRLSILVRRKEEPREECGNGFRVPTSCVWGGWPRPSALSLTGSMCLGLRGKRLGNTKHTK